jgi:hypothetical protein
VWPESRPRRYAVATRPTVRLELSQARRRLTRPHRHPAGWLLMADLDNHRICAVPLGK